MDTFDYKELKNIIDKNYMHLNETMPHLYMEQAYILYFIEDYLASYNCLKSASSLYYKKRDYIKYFISEVNRYFVGKIVVEQNKWTISNIQNHDIKSISIEVNGMDLERTFRSLPNLGGKNKVLKDIYTFNMAYVLFQDAYIESEKVKKQANTNYIIFSGTTAFSSFRNNVEDYYRFEVLNHLMIDKYKENIEIFKLYFQSILGSVMTSDKSSDTENMQNRAGNIHANELCVFDIKIALRYVEFKELKEMLRNTSTNICLNKKAEDYLLKVMDNYSVQSQYNIFLMNDVLWKIICLLERV